jgi:methanogenic corrinoid protein MtbC1
VVHRYLELIEVADRRGALALVADLAAAGVSVETLVLELLAPAQREVGVRWERREWTVAQEHAATAITDAALALVTLDDITPRLGHVLVGCVEGEWHMMPARMAAEIFRERGWAMTFLGPSVPAVDLAAYVAATRPDAVALSCSLAILLPGAQRCILACREEDVPVLAGGAGFASDGRYAVALGANAWVQDPVAGVGYLESWLDAPPPSGQPTRRPDDEDRMLEASHAELLSEAFQRLAPRAAATADVATVVAALDMVLAAVESATLVGESKLLSASSAMIERVMPQDDSSGSGFAVILEGLLPALRQRSPRAAGLVERALPAVARRH